MTNIISDKTFKYSEIFYSFQGEGKYTGAPTAWVRFFKCNLQCDGFGQEDPTNPDTYVLPYKDLDVSQFTKVEDLPVFDYGCDSSYTWSKKYRHLMKDETAMSIAGQLELAMAHDTNPLGNFVHPLTGQDTHLAFTGGEPMLSQDAITAVMAQFNDNMPEHITVETNGTRMVTEAFADDYTSNLKQHFKGNNEWFWSVSPKLFSTSGEKAKKAIRPEVVASYMKLSNAGQLKFVVNGTDASWLEVEEATKAFREAGVDWPVYIMPVGATKEQQEDGTIADIAIEAMHRGYYFSGRLHAHIFGNQIGT